MAAEGSEKIKKYSCFTEEQQAAYERLLPRQRLYVDYRGQGSTKTLAYLMAGYSETNNVGQAAYLMEKRNSVIGELITCLQSQKQVRDLSIKESKLNRRIDALATQESAENAIKVIEGADSETARRIQFYRDVINGKIKTVRRTSRYDKFGKRIDTKIEEVADVESKMKARKELDKILGLALMPDLGSLQMGDITINIVDASKKEELEDSRNQILLSPDDVQTIDGEQVIIQNDRRQNVKGVVVEDDEQEVEEE